MPDGKIRVPNINFLILSGRVASDPEVKFTQSGKQFASFSIAVSTPKRAKSGEGWAEPDTFFIKVTAFDFLADKVQANLQKGSPVVVEGRLRGYKYNTPEKENIKAFDVTASRIYPLLFAASSSETQPQEASDYSYNGTAQNEDDDIPF